MRKLLSEFALLALLAPAALRAEAGPDNFYLKAGAGYSVPFLDALSGELELQGRGGVDPGYCFGVSLGRTLKRKSFALELHFVVSFYPEFDYGNEHENIFTGNLSHYGYSLVFRKRLPSPSRRLDVSLGAGLGYGRTNLISGGGKISTFEALAILHLEIPASRNAGVFLDATYCSGLQKDSFDNPFIENVPDDVIRDSSGDPLMDRFGAVEIKIGAVIWLKRFER